MGGAGAGTGWRFRGRLRRQGDTGPWSVPKRSSRGERWAMRRPHPTPFFPVLPRPSFCLWSMWGILFLLLSMLILECWQLHVGGIILIILYKVRTFLWMTYYWFCECIGYILLSAFGNLREARVLFIFPSGGCIWGLLSGQALSTNVHHDNFYIENCLCYFYFSL